MMETQDRKNGRFVQTLSIKERFLHYAQPEPNSGCWIWTASCDRKGYGIFNVQGRTSTRAHRAAYELFVGDIPEGYLVCHKCDSPFCVNPDHLFVGTNFDNTQDCLLKGRARKAHGSDNGNSRLRIEQVREIKQALSKDDPPLLEDIARAYGVTYGTISHIKNGRTWKGIV